MPHIPGVEGVGIVADPNGSTFKVGQAVAFLGTIGVGAYSEYVAARKSTVVALPPGVDLQKAAVIPVSYLTAYTLLHRKARISEGDTAMIYAASGGVGTALLQLCKLYGVKTIALERKHSKLRLAKSQGSDLAICTGDNNWHSLVKEFTKNKGVNHTFNPVSGVTLKDDLELISTNGNIVIYGMLGSKDEIDLLAESTLRFNKSPSIHFSELYSYFEDPAFLRSSLSSLYSLLSRGKIDPIYKLFPLNEASKAHQLLQSGQIHGKALLSLELQQ